MRGIVTVQILDDNWTIETVVDNTPPFYFRSSKLFYTCFLTTIEDIVLLTLKSFSGDLIYQLHSREWKPMHTEMGSTKITMSDDFRDVFAMSKGTVHMLKHGQFAQILEIPNSQSIFSVYGNKNDLIIQAYCSHNTDYRLFQFQNGTLIPLITHGDLTKILSSRLSKILFFSDNDRILSNIFQLQGDIILLIQSASMDNDFILLNMTKKRKIITGFSNIIYSGKINNEILLIDADGSIVSITVKEKQLIKTKKALGIPSKDRIRSISLDKNNHWIILTETGIYKSINGKMITLIKRKNDSIHIPTSVLL